MIFDELRSDMYVKFNPILDRMANPPDLWYGMDIKRIWNVTASRVSGSQDDYVVLIDAHGMDSMKISRSEYIEGSNEINGDLLIKSSFQEMMAEVSMPVNEDVVIDTEEETTDIMNRLFF